MYGPGINCMERERNEPVFYNYFCSFRNDGSTIALYAGGGFMKKIINYLMIVKWKYSWVLEFWPLTIVIPLMLIAIVFGAALGWGG